MTRSRARSSIETDKPSEILNFPFLNPQNGPIYVNGAEKGDTLAVYIKSIVPRGPQPVGTTCLIREFGGLVATGDTALLKSSAAGTGQEGRGHAWKAASNGATS